MRVSRGKWLEKRIASKQHLESDRLQNRLFGDFNAELWSAWEPLINSPHNKSRPIKSMTYTWLFTKKRIVQRLPWSVES
jgi:hypothetical protein